MSSPTSEPIVTAAEMRAAEAASGVPAWELMRRAGEGAARAIAAFDGPLPALVLCGPGNNGGDGYVIAATLKAMGWPVRVAALAPPATDCALKAAALWDGAVETLDAEPAPLLIDALFGTGLSRPLGEEVVAALHRLAGAARLRVAVDLPSGASTDTGEPLSALAACELTVTFGALKPAHLLFPAAAAMGRTVVVDIGTRHDTTLTVIGEPVLPPMEGGAHKFERGHVAVVSGPLGSTGAARMAAM